MSIISSPHDDLASSPGDELALPTDHLDTDTPGDDRRRSRWPMVATAVVLVGGGAALWWVTRDGDSASADVEPVTIRTVEAEQRDLVEFSDLAGTLGHAEVRTVNTISAGTITWIADDGVDRDRGETLYELDARPVVVFHGDQPFYRPLRAGLEGDDVRILEQNLAALGFHVDDVDDPAASGLVVDGVFDADTTAAVERWQESLGLEPTGAVEPGDAVVTAGPVRTSAVRPSEADVVQPGQPVLDLIPIGTVETVHADRGGELTIAAASGPITTGAVVYVVDDEPITALLTDEPLDRDLGDGIDDGTDVFALEQMLVDLGHDLRGDLVPDDEFDELTTEAIEAWETELAETWDGVVVDGVASVDQFLRLAPDTVLGSRAALDDETAAGSVLFTASTTGTDRVVTTSIPVADQTKLAEGAEVDVEFPDGAVVTGVVAEIATASTVDPTDPTADPELAVEISLAEVPESAAGLSEVDVEVRLVDELVAEATVVPASALVAAADGRYAVEVVESGATRFVAVEPGLFTDGMVAVTGIEPGTMVVVPS